MINLSRAIEIVNNNYPELVISLAGRIEKGWIFSFENIEGKALRISPVFVSAENGEIRTFFPPEHRDDLRNYKKIEL